MTMSDCLLPGEFSGAVSVFYPEKNNGHFFFLVLSVISCLETQESSAYSVQGHAGLPQLMCWWSVVGLAGQPRR